MGFALGEGEIDNSVQNLEREEEEYQRLYSRITQEESKFTAAGLEPKDEDEEDEDDDILGDESDHEYEEEFPEEIREHEQIEAEEEGQNPQY